ncbi:MAG: hypothetical protein IIC67_03035 [Thaumarchaeota archaeon]|nr:hypothetical protein [Nitrososphaerota archaeon]
MRKSEHNGGSSIKKQTKISTPMVTDFGIRKISNQNFSKVITLPKTALENCGGIRTSKFRVELVQEKGKRFIKLSPVRGGKK